MTKSPSLGPDAPLDVDRLTSEERRQFTTMGLKLGKARKMLDEFWSRRNPSNPYDRETAWAMHVMLVALTELLKKGATS